MASLLRLRFRIECRQPSDFASPQANGVKRVARGLAASHSAESCGVARAAGLRTGANSGGFVAHPDTDTHLDRSTMSRSGACYGDGP